MAAPNEIPETEVEYGEQGPQVPPTDISGIPLFLGYSTKGVPMQLTVNATLDDARALGGGVLAHAVASVVQRGQLCLSVSLPATSPGSVGPISKQYGKPLGFSVRVGGAVYVPGADVNGGLIVTQKLPGASFQTIVTGPSKTLKVRDPGATGTAVVVELATDGASKPTTTYNDLAGALSLVGRAALLVDLAPLPASTGAGVVGAMVAAAQLDDGAMNLTALRQPLTVTAGYSAKGSKISAKLTGSALALSWATDADGAPSSTPIDLMAALQAAGLDGEVAVSLAGTGRLLALPSGSASLAFGSTGSMTVAAGSTPTDRGDLVVKVVKAGTVGAGAGPVVQVSNDDADSANPLNRGGSYGPELTVPADGVLDAGDGLKVVLAGQLDENDRFRASYFGPDYSRGSLLQALQEALDNDDDVKQFGFAVALGPFDGPSAVSVDSLLQAARKPPISKQPLFFFGPRDQAEGEPSSTYENAILADFFGPSPVVSDDGILNGFDGYCRMLDPLTNTWRRRTLAIVAAVLRSVRPVHEQLGCRNPQTGPGSMTKYGVQSIYRNAIKRPALARGGFTGAQIVTGRGPYFTEWVTMAPKRSYYREGPTAAVAAFVARICVETGRDYELDIVGQDTKTGGVGITDAAVISRKFTSAISVGLFSTKVDGKVSAESNPSDVPLAFVPTNVKISVRRELPVTVQFFRVVAMRKVLIQLNVVVPLGSGQ